MIVRLNRSLPIFREYGGGASHPFEADRSFGKAVRVGYSLPSFMEGTADGDASRFEPGGMSETAWLFNSATFFHF